MLAARIIPRGASGEPEIERGMLHIPGLIQRSVVENLFVNGTRRDLNKAFHARGPCQLHQTDGAEHVLAHKLDQVPFRTTEPSARSPQRGMDDRVAVRASGALSSASRRIVHPVRRVLGRLPDGTIGNR